MADADLPRCLTFPPAISSRSPMTGPSAYAVDRFQPAARSGEWTRRHPPPGTGPDFPNPATASIRSRAPFVPATPGPRSSAPSASDTDRRDSSFPADHRTHHLVRLVSSRNLRVLDLRTEKNLDVLQIDDQISTGQHPDVWATCHRLVDAARRWWTDIDAIVYRSRTTPESSLNYAFFGDEGFEVECVAPRRADRRSDRSCSAPGLHRQLGYRRRLVDAPCRTAGRSTARPVRVRQRPIPQEFGDDNNVPAFTVLVSPPAGGIVGEPRR